MVKYLAIDKKYTVKHFLLVETATLLMNSVRYNLDFRKKHSL